MPIEMPRGLPFSVDTWSQTSKMKNHHFLTHAHKDHCSGITSYSSFPIYSTHLTKSLTLRYFTQCLAIDDPDGSFSVTAFDANHCPGAVMFLFEGSFGNILHTGDCRLTPECLQSLPEKYMARKGKEPSCQLDFVFLDCTFGRSLMKIPSTHSAIQQVINCIWKHPDARTVYLTCDMLGQEAILVHVFNTFGSKIYVDKANHLDFYRALELIAPQIISNDPSSRFHLYDGFPKLYERAKKKISEARENMQPEPLIIRPSAQWYACEETELTSLERKVIERSNIPLKDQFGVWHICYSMHSSRQELEWALQLLAPKWVVSTTPECRAMELEYVKKHCFGTRDDRFWKLLDIAVEDSLEADVFVESSICSSIAETSELQMVKKLNSSPLSKKPPLTLFGHARLGYNSCILAEEMRAQPVKDGSRNVIANEDVESEVEKANESTIEVENGEKEHEKSKKIDIPVCKSASYSSIGTSKGFSDNLRKLYRTMNAPVPQPLPSLVELMKANKRAKRHLFEF